MKEENKIKQIGNIPLKDPALMIDNALSFFIKEGTNTSVIEINGKGVRYINSQGISIACLSLITLKRATPWRSWEELICELIVQLKEELDNFDFPDVLEALKEMKV